MSDFNFNTNMCSMLCSVQDQKNESGTHAQRTSGILANNLEQRKLSLQRGAPAPWLATHSAQSQRNLLAAKIKESITLDRQARKSAEGDFEGSRLKMNMARLAVLSAFHV